MAKIKFIKWKESLKVEKVASSYRIDGLEWWKTYSDHGRSRGKVKCPCCEYVTEIYIWSFCGCGKRCSNCNVSLSTSGAYVSANELTNEVLVNETHILLNNQDLKRIV